VNIPAPPGHTERVLAALARGIDHTLNPGTKANGFVLLAFPLGETAPSANYVSNISDRREMARLMRSVIERWEAGE
jgi:hypothetical protein